MVIGIDDVLMGAQAFSAAAGGIKSLFGGGQKRGPDAEDQILLNARNFEETFRTKMEMGKEYGIHPLAMLGVSDGGFSPSYQVDGNNGPDFESMGQNVGRLRDALSSKGERGIQKAMNALQLERAALENKLLASQITSINRSNIPPRVAEGRFVPGQGQDDIQINPTVTGDPRHAFLYEKDGRVIPILNPDAGDNEILMMWDFIQHTAPAEFKNLVGRTWDNIKNKFKSARYRDIPF